ncbi:hypothetical protein DL765_010098 [Monosporascus sp. GIB2]|nr:hypothetical protein DL765_010098 [Monosporascus sp. GIB2]
MQVNTIVVALGIASTACASCPALPEGTWRAPRAGDVRSPCPMLNVLANHGYLPRDGKNISRTICRDGMLKGLNIGNSFADLMFDPALLTNPHPDQDTFDLDMLNRHGILEHDGSLTRADAYWDNTQVFNETIYDQTLSVLGQGVNVTLETAAAARLLRVETSAATNPTFYLNATNEAISLGETAAYLLALGDPVTGEAPLDRVRMMFEQEMLPWSLGWNASGRVTTAEDLFTMTERVINSTVWPAKLKARMYVGFHGGIVSKRNHH